MFSPKIQAQTIDLRQILSILASRSPEQSAIQDVIQDNTKNDILKKPLNGFKNIYGPNYKIQMAFYRNCLRMQINLHLQSIQKMLKKMPIIFKSTSGSWMLSNFHKNFKTRLSSIQNKETKMYLESYRVIKLNRTFSIVQY